MAQTKGNQKDLRDPEPGQAVQSVTEVVPHEADASSQPGPYNDLPLHRPPVSSNRPDSILAHSLVAGAGAPTGEPDYRPELGPDQDTPLGQPAAATVSDEDTVVEAAPAATPDGGTTTRRTAK